MLGDEPRSGAPGKFTPEQVARSLAVACEPPENSGRPITRWTALELTDEVVPRGIVTSVEEITLANAEAIGYGVTIEMENGGVGKDYNFKSWRTALKT